MCIANQKRKLNYLNALSVLNHEATLQLINRSNYRFVNHSSNATIFELNSHGILSSENLQYLVYSNIIQSEIANTSNSPDADEGKYLDVQLLEWFRKQLASWKIWKSTMHSLKLITYHLFKMSEPLQEQQSNHILDGGYLRDSDIVDSNSNGENRLPIHTQASQQSSSISNDAMKSQSAKLRLKKNLRLSKFFNLFLIVCHGLLLIKSANLNMLMRYFTQTGALNLQSRAKGFQDVIGHVNSQYDQENMCYYLVFVTVLDFLNNLYWYRSRETISRIGSCTPEMFRIGEVAWFKSLLHFLTSPRHLFHVIYVSLLITIGQVNDNVSIAIRFHNSLNQIMRHSYNLHRVVRYLKILESNDSVSGQLDDSNVIDHSDCQCPDDVDTGGEKCKACASADSSEGWTHWPVKLSSCVCEFRASYRCKFEQLLMMSQILGVKITIFTILQYMDSHSLNGPCTSVISIGCLVGSFLAMHSYYDKYHSRYLEQTTC